jgi:hypothetical protein
LCSRGRIAERLYNRDPLNAFNARGPEAGFAGREAKRVHFPAEDTKKGADGGNMVSPIQNDHGLLTWEPAIGRQIQSSPLALRRALQVAS